MKNRRQSFNAFTLIELLIVIAVIAVLASLLLPALSSAQFHAKNAACKNNLRQLGQAAHIYTGNYGAYPLYLTFLEEQGAIMLEWDQLLEKEMSPERNVVPIQYSGGPYNPGPFYSRSRVHPSFKCPLVLPLWADDQKKNPLPDASRYGYNEWGIGGSMYANNNPSLGLCAQFGDPTVSRPCWPQPESIVAAPSDMISFGDPFTRSLNSERDALLQWADWRPSPSVAPLDSFFGFPEKSKASARTHRYNFNKAFCDGHVERENFNGPFVDSDRYLRQWNVDNQPHRELWNSSYY